MVDEPITRAPRQGFESCDLADTEHALEHGFRLVELGDLAGAERAYRYADER
jgi:hypothetical protein